MKQPQSDSEYIANDKRYQKMTYNYCGKHGLKLPQISLGLWQNFGAVNSIDSSRELLRCAFDNGINHFDLANNYGPPYGSAETTFGRLFKSDFSRYRDEVIVSSKAGYDMWKGPYGNWGSRKHLLTSCDQSLKRTGLEYFDIFYHHRMDPETPLEETMTALDHMVRSGRALYVGISNYQPEQTQKAISILESLGTPMIIHQARYNLFDRWIEDGLCDILNKNGVGVIAFSPLAQGLLTNKYLNGIPQNSRAANKDIVHFGEKNIDKNKIKKIMALSLIANKRGQNLAQMSISWVLNNKSVTSCLIGASKKEQIIDSLGALDKLVFLESELNEIHKLVSRP